MKLITTLAISLFISGCSLSGKKPPDKLYYRFPETTQASQTNLIIKRPSAAGIIGNRPMVAQNSDGSLIQMQHNFWLESPKALLQNYLEKTFVSNINIGTTSNVLNTHILHLEKKQNTVILAITFTITNNKRQQIFKKTYKQEGQLQHNTIPAFVSSFSTLLENIVSQFSREIP
ncbi:MAG: membrane integrity-associated transporter subunit PqiC [Alcanivoracaceae bacterium]|nr:membrane integrity-associated transporter subunit PqiC [Alcanivoracaceae bacterium]